MRLLSFVHVCNNCRYCCMDALAEYLLVCVDVMGMSYAYEVSCSGAGGRVMSDVYVLKNVGEGRLLEGRQFYIDVVWMCVSKCCVYFAPSDVVCYEFDNGVWDVCVCM